MASSRIFIKGLPPTFTDAEFRKHFSQNGRNITDAKIFSNRRIGYVGYKTPEDAQQAVKYFNRTFIRMSKIGVELARPVEEAKSTGRSKALIAKPEDVLPVPSADGGERKRKRDSKAEDESDSKLQEFLETYQPKSKKKAWESDIRIEHNTHNPAVDEETIVVADADSDVEYEQVPKKQKDSKTMQASEQVHHPDLNTQTDLTAPVPGENGEEDIEVTSAGATMSDLDWARSRTSRLLGLLDDEEEREDTEGAKQVDDSDREDDPKKDMLHQDSELQPKDTEQMVSMPTPPADQHEPDAPADADLTAARSSMRLFIRNLPYDIKGEDLEAEFAPYGNLEEVHVALDKKTGSGKGFAYIQYSNSDSAEKAMVDRDGRPFQGRLLHVLAAATRRETKLDDFALSKLPIKKQQEIKRRREAASSTFNWNALYMNADAVVSSVADRLGLSKSEVLDPTSSDAAIKQAHAETHIIQETKSYFRQHGVDLDSFKRSQRGDTTILVKNIPYDCSKDELKRLFEEQGDVKRFLMPPAGTIAIVEFANAAQCKAAFGALAYRKVKSSVLFLERAPKDVFHAKPIADEPEHGPEGINKVSTNDLREADQKVPETSGTATLFVRNLNFSTSTQLLTNTFKPLEGFLSARVKTKMNPKKPGQVLSMGFGFLEFKSSRQAQAALQAMDGYTLEGHKLQIRASHKGADAAEEQRKANAEKKAASQKTKVIIKNLPFEATKKDVRALFGAYGQLRSVRVPKKMDRAARGFAFADFTTAKEAQNAVNALRDTHLLGRRLVLDFASEDPEDAEAEIEKMQQKVGAQVNKVALQKLTSGGRKKFTTQNDEDEG